MKCCSIAGDQYRALKVHGHEFKLHLNTQSMWLWCFSPVAFSMAADIKIDLRVKIFLKSMLREEKGKKVSGVWKM